MPPLSLFQSTRPIRGATHTSRDQSAQKENFNPRAPYGARRRGRSFPPNLGGISIHAPHTGRDYHDVGVCPLGDGISIHAPHTGRDAVSSVGTQQSRISIHAPHTGRDGTACCFSAARWDFNPRAPYGARRSCLPSTPFARNFNPRAPYGARLGGIWAVLLLCHISIHAPHTGRDAPRRSQTRRT